MNTEGLLARASVSSLDPEFLDRLAALVPHDVRLRMQSVEAALTDADCARLDDATIARICARLRRPRAAPQAVIDHLRTSGLRLLVDVGEAVADAVQDATGWLREAIAWARDENAAPGLVHATYSGLGAPVDGTAVSKVELVVHRPGRDRAPPREVPLADVPRWLGDGRLRLRLRLGADVETSDGWGIARLRSGGGGQGNNVVQTQAGPLVADPDEHGCFVLEVPFPSHQRGDGMHGQGVTVPGPVVHEVHLFPGLL